MNLDRAFRCIFMGSPEFAVPTLLEIAHAFPGSVSAVLTQPDAPRGRGKRVSPTPVAELADQFQIPIYKPTSKFDILPILQRYEPDLVIVVAFGMILPRAVTDNFFCINGHASLLPKYRGAAPIHFALLNGETETGVTLIALNEVMDAGEMLAKEPLPIGPKDNLGTTHDALSHLCAEMTISFINDFLMDTMQSEPQVEDEATYTRKLTKADAQLDLSRPAIDLFNQVRAFAPSPVAFTILPGGVVLKVIEAEVVDDIFVPVTVKPEGKPSMPYRDYLLGHPPIL